MKNLLLTLIVLAAILSSCTKWQIEKDTPKCVKKEIVQFNKDQSCDDLKVDEYTYQGTSVFVFVIGNTCGADMSSKVIDEDCNTLGNLGGIAGNGEDFGNAVFVKTVWEK